MAVERNFYSIHREFDEGMARVWHLSSLEAKKIQSIDINWNHNKNRGKLYNHSCTILLNNCFLPWAYIQVLENFATVPQFLSNTCSFFKGKGTSLNQPLKPLNVIFSKYKIFHTATHTVVPSMFSCDLKPAII